MKRIALTALATLGTAATVVTLAAQPGSASTRPEVHVSTFSVPMSSQTSTFVGADENNPVIGDRYVESYALQRGGKTIGHAYNDCTLVAGRTEDDSVGQCLTTFVLPKGQLTSVGVPSNSSTSVLPLAGGSGYYAYTTGTATTTFSAGAAKVTLRYVRTR